MSQDALAGKGPDYLEPSFGGQTWLERTPQVEPPAVEHVERQRPASSRIMWLLGLLLVFFTLRYLVPEFAEEMQYAVTRGQQRAQHEMAGAQLQDFSLEQLSRVSQLVSQRVKPSVVHINTSGAAESHTIASLESPRDPLEFFPERSTGQGSGVIVDADGYILTNAHVVVGSEQIEVKLSDGRMRVAKLVGLDVLTDLAVLKIDADGLLPADWGDSRRLEVGSVLWAVGSPFGLDHSITLGILSAKNRGGMAGRIHQDFLQTDAAVNPGNSGGPLVDAQGRVVGINTAIVGQAYQGISFAIPSSVAREIYERLKSNGHVVRGWFGVEPEQVPRDLAAQVGLNAATGAYVARVVNDQASPASRAGVREGDVVLRWNGLPIDGPAALFTAVGMTEVGSTVDVVVWRDGAELTLKVNVAERP